MKASVVLYAASVLLFCAAAAEPAVQGLNSGKMRNKPGIITGSSLIPNLYANPEFQTYTDKKGKIHVKGHWYFGKILEVGKKDGKNAIKFHPAGVSRGNFNAVMCGYPKNDRQPPGKYCFSVWCLVEPGKKVEDVLNFHVSMRYKADGKIKYDSKKYAGTEKPVPGKWFEMTGIFEITADKQVNDFLFGHFGKSPVTVWYANPTIERIEE